VGNLLVHDNGWSLGRHDAGELSLKASAAPEMLCDEVSGRSSSQNCCCRRRWSSEVPSDDQVGSVNRLGPNSTYDNPASPSPPYFVLCCTKAT
jgi:hypothetical protein